LKPYRFVKAETALRYFSLRIFTSGDPFYRCPKGGSMSARKMAREWQDDFPFGHEKRLPSLLISQSDVRRATLSVEFIFKLP
jgi:hypothetical protein